MAATTVQHPVKDTNVKTPLFYKILNVLAYIGIYALLFTLAMIIIYPVLWIVGSSFNKGTSLATSSAIPKNFTFDNYVKLFKDLNYGKWYMNTLKIAVVNSLVSVLFSGTMGFVFARLRFAGKKVGLMLILILQMFPTFMGMVAIYALFLYFGLLDKPMALVLIYSVGQIPYNTWLIKGYLMNIPMSLDESAYVDGATKFQTFRKIILPLMSPILIFVAVTQFMAPWFDFILPNYLISSDKNRTLAVGLYRLITGNENNNFTVFAAGAVLVAVPVTILYLSLQKYLIEGITAGANKG